MANLIPPFLSASCKSPAEREVFARLKADPYTKGWHALHSLDVAHHHSQIRGEIDFVVIIPEKGVLCVEVKGWQRLDSRKLPVPFKQATDGVESLRKYIRKKRPDLSKVVFYPAVIFPYINANPAEFQFQFHSWQLIDKAKYERRSIGKELEAVLNNARQLLKQTPSSARWFDPQSKLPNRKQCKIISDTLRPEFEFYQSPRDRLKEIKSRIKTFTEEQFEALDEMSENDRVIFEGPAGTGKSLLAIEAARRAIEANKSVLFVCFNELLSFWIKQQFEGVLKPDRLNYFTYFHDYMQTVSGLNQGDKTDTIFYQEVLPAAARDTPEPVNEMRHARLRN